MALTRAAGSPVRRGALGVALVWVLTLADPAAGILADLSPADIQLALELGTTAMIQEDFGEEWHVRLAGGEEILVTTPFSRLAFAARQAAFRGAALTEKQRQEQLDRGKGKLQLLVTMYGRQVDFARWYQPVLRVGDREVKATFTQNERTALRLEHGRFAARNVYVFPLDGLPPRGTVSLVVRGSVDQKEILRAPLDLSKMR